MSGDYTYNDNESVDLSSTDSGANTATSLAGYDGEIDPDPNWPGLERNPKEIVADPEVMRDVVKELRALADKVRESSAVREVERTAGEVSLGPQDWAGTGYLKQAGVQTATIVATGAKQIADNLDLAADAIEAAANGYDNADQGNQSGFNQ